MKPEEAPLPEADSRAGLRTALRAAASLLPSQGPIGTFIHHNTLHAFQHMPFHEAVRAASARFQTEPYLSEEEYRECFERGRIGLEDLNASMAERERRRSDEVGSEEIALGLTRGALEWLCLLHPLHEPSAAELEWSIEEAGLCAALGSDLPKQATSSLFAACQECLEALPSRADPELAQTSSPGSMWSAALGPDETELTLVNALLIRMCAAHLDLGMATFPLPKRERGFYRAFIALVTTRGAPLPKWLSGLPGELAEWERRGASAQDVVLGVLAREGVPLARYEPYLADALLELPGWAGMFHRIEHDPELCAHFPVPVSLLDYLAVRLVCRAHVRAQLASEHRREAARSAHAVQSALAAPAPRDPEAYLLFRVARLAHGSPADRARMTPRDAERVLAVLRGFGAHERRRVWHEAYELHYRDEVLRAVSQNARRRDEHATSRPAARSRLQVVFCLDEREEAIRRHFEELAPEYETFGVAGFFGLAIEWHGLDDTVPTARCPVAVRPAHRVLEHPERGEERAAEARRRRRVGAARTTHSIARGSRRFFRAALLTWLLGFLSIVPAVVSIFFPRAAALMRRRFGQAFLPRPKTCLSSLRESEDPVAEDKALGFTLTEIADRVEAMLRSLGLTHGFAPLVLLLGHDSQSRNNPHASAYECGACGGRGGGPNARLFAEAANRADLRGELRARGIVIPEDTVFLGGEHDTCSEELTLFDIQAVPAPHRELLDELRDALDHARTLSAHERCRRFESAALGITPKAALRHVEERAADLGQPRPELGHATNAACIIGRRHISRGLFLDRRAFLISYDPEQDTEGALLEQILAAAGPVCAGINLEYYFSRVDNDRYGCGTKLPHNITGLFGVMDGHGSDLRTGLPWQMAEIHEPMRLLVLLEASAQTALAVLERLGEVAELAKGGWMRFCTIDPRSRELHAYEPGRGFVPLALPAVRLPEVADSRAWYAGRCGFLPPARVIGEPDASRSTRGRTPRPSHVQSPSGVHHD